MKFFSYVLIACAFASFESAAVAQPRVVHPNRGGLAHPASTQIGEGTVSPSARGNTSKNFGLPVTPLGPNVRAGDVSRRDLNYGNQQRVRQNQSGSGGNTGGNTRGNLLRGDVPQANPNLPAAPIGPNVRAGDVSRSDLHQRGGQTNPGLPAAPIGPHMRAGDIDRSDLHPERYASNRKFWNGGTHPQAKHAQAAATSSRSQTAAAHESSRQPATATYKNTKTTSEGF